LFYDKITIGDRTHSIMKLILDNNQFSQTPETFLRQAGYVFLEDRKTGNESFVRPLNRGYYPRFHLYLDQSPGKLIFNLHLDQKQASYAGAHMHNGEYDGDLVQSEIDRLKGLAVTEEQPIDFDQEDLLDKIRPKQFSNARTSLEKRSWWRKFFR
jgi:hypothetical protein